jgi:hypothetical protein
MIYGFGVQGVCVSTIRASVRLQQCLIYFYDEMGALIWNGLCQGAVESIQEQMGIDFNFSSNCMAIA